MRVMLVNSPWICDKDRYSVKSGARWPHIRDRRKTIPYFPYPFAMAYATSALKRAGHDVRMLDAVALEMSTVAALSEIETWLPDMVVLETSTPSIYVDMEFARQLDRQSDTSIVYCGPHATALPRDVLTGAPGIAILRGEYDETIVDLVDALENARHLDTVRGIAWRDGDTVRTNPARSLIQNLDDLPLPERDSLPMEKYTDPACKKYPNVSILASRGCPHQCVFCLESTVFFHSPSFRPRDPAEVVDEMELVVQKYGAREVYFDDSSFTVNRQHARAIAEEIIRRKFRVTWSAMADARVDDDTLRLLYRSGCIGLKFGVETADKERMLAINKNLNLDSVARFVKTCHKLGIATHGTFMFGLPGDTSESLERTLAYAKKLKCTTSQFSVATPFPGTPFYDEAVRNNWLSTSDWSRWDGGGSPVVSYPECSAEEIVVALEKARKMKIKRLLTNPPVLAQYIWKLYKIKGLKGLMIELINKTRYLMDRSDKKKSEH